MGSCERIIICPVLLSLICLMNGWYSLSQHTAAMALPANFGDAIAADSSRSFDLGEAYHFLPGTPPVQSVIALPNNSFYLLFGPDPKYRSWCMSLWGWHVAEYVLLPRLKTPVIHVDASGPKPVFNATLIAYDLLEMPVKMVMDNQNRIWFLDAFRMQVFCVDPENVTAPPIITIGLDHKEAFVNTDSQRLCYPRDIAIASDGRIFIADGCFCMSSVHRMFNTGRMLIFRPDGTFEKDLFAAPGHTQSPPWPLLRSSPETAVALGESEDELYVGKFQVGRAFNLNMTGNVSVASPSEPTNKACGLRYLRLVRSKRSNMIYAAVKNPFYDQFSSYIYSIDPNSNMNCERLNVTTDMYGVADISLSSEDILYVVTNKVKNTRGNSRNSRNSRSCCDDWPMVHIFT